jgi:two-component sensor histidine kinase
LAATELLALDAADHPALAVLKRQVTALVRMTDDLLDASRALTGRLEVVRRPLDLRSTVDAAVKDIRPGYTRTDRTLLLTLPAEPVVVEGDGIRLAQTLGNLLSNACKYTHPGGTVRVELTSAAGQAVLTMRDDGIGFEPAAADRLFEVFARAVPSGMTDAGGLGLGLAIVRSIVELHGGTVSAHSEGPATGAEFRVALPLTRSLDCCPVQLFTASQVPAALRTLIIEDNVDLAATFEIIGSCPIVQYGINTRDLRLELVGVISGLHCSPMVDPGEAVCERSDATSASLDDSSDDNVASAAALVVDIEQCVEFAAEPGRPIGTAIGTVERHGPPLDLGRRCQAGFHVCAGNRDDNQGQAVSRPSDVGQQCVSLNLALAERVPLLRITREQQRSHTTYVAAYPQLTPCADHAP